MPQTDIRFQSDRSDRYPNGNVVAASAPIFGSTDAPRAVKSDGQRRLEAKLTAIEAHRTKLNRAWSDRIDMQPETNGAVMPWESQERKTRKVFVGGKYVLVDLLENKPLPMKPKKSVP